MQENKINKTFFKDFTICLLLTIFVFIISRRYLSGGIGDDEHALIPIGYFMHNGLLPYRDFFINKPIIYNFLIYLSFVIFGINNCAYKLLPFVLIYPSVTLFYLALNRLNIHRLLATIITGYLYLLILSQDFHDLGNFNSETFGIIFVIYAFCSFYLFKNNFGSFLCGFFIALSANTKEPFLLFLLPLSLFIFMEENPLRINKNRFLSLMSGFLFVNLMFLLYLIFTGSVEGYIDKNDWCYNYAARSKELGLVKIPDDFLGVLAYDFKKINCKYNNFIVFAPFFIIYFFYFSVIKHLKPGLFLSIISIICGLYAVSLGHRFYEHYFIIGIFPFTALAIYCAREISENLKLSKNKSINKLFFMGLIYIFAVNSATAFFQEITTNYKPQRLEDEFPVFMKKVLPIIKKYTNEKDKILIAGYPSLYYLANRLPATVHPVIEQHIFLVGTKKIPTEKRISMFLDEIKKNKPKIIYFQSEYMSAIHRMNFIFKKLYPYMKENNYFDCGNGLFLREIPGKRDREKYCVTTIDSIRLDYPETIIPFSVEASSEKSDEFKIENIFDNNLSTEWLDGSDNSAIITLYPKTKSKIKLIWLLPCRRYDIYQGWNKILIKFYMSGKLMGEQKFFSPNLYKRGIQKIKLKSVLADKIEIYLAKEDANKKNIFGDTLNYPFECGYTEVLLQKETK